MRISLVVATVGRTTELRRLLASLTVQTHRDFEVIVVDQNADMRLAPILEEFEGKLEIRHLAVFPVRGLSRARNLGIRALTGQVVCFPDDDCWYPRGTLELVARSFAQSPQLGLWFCRYSSKPSSVAEAGRIPRVASARDVVRQASSNTMFVRGRMLHANPVFDETLGVGTINGGGEDTEFALRAYLASRHSLHLPAPVIGHRDNTPQLRPKYYRGSLIALARHARQQPLIGYEFVRKLAVGLWLVLTRQLPVSSFKTAITVALKSRRPAAA
jgi:glycosyltransferase involved in cell wall biosynthesis